VQKAILSFVLCLLATIFGFQPQEPVKRNRILLIPLDSRPAAGQFAQMIGAMNATKVDIPPLDILGKFTVPGDVDKVFTWLESENLDDVSTIIVSGDMLAYGGLIASRVNDVDAGAGIKRLQRLMDFKRKAPADVKMYVFMSTMRLTPTATKAASGYRINLAKYEEMKDRYERTHDATLPAKLNNMRKVVPAVEIMRYERTRRRNIEVQSGLLRMCIGPEVDFLIMGQDDAKPDGPQIQENAKLKKLAEQYGVQKKVYFCEGIDQHSNLLLSRAILAQRNWKPRVRIVYSDEDGKNQYALYESKTIKESLEDQLFASGAEMAKDNGEYDYSLYVNSPKRRDSHFEEFLEKMRSEIDQGFPVAVADINFSANGSSDESLFNFLVRSGKAYKLLAFAGWNTAGNTMGTSIPAANVYLCARKNDVDPLSREVAQREFLLHRMINDWAYHRYTRPATYAMIDTLQDQRDEIYGSNFDAINKFANADLRRHIAQIFQNQFQLRRFTAGNKEYQITDLDDLKISLPWPRAYEIRVEFKMKVEETGSGSH
jgi:hypothetical protein